MSWFQYPARRLKGLAGGDYHRTRKGYGGTRKGDIIFEVMESRVMPRCVGKIERAPALRLSVESRTRPNEAAVKFGTIVPDLIGTSIGNDHYAKQEELLFDLCDAMHDELADLAWSGLRDHSDGRAEHPSRRDPARWRRAAAPGRVLRRDVQPDRQGPARPDRSVVPHLLGESGTAAVVCDEPVVQERAAAVEQARRGRDAFETSANEGLDLEHIGKEITGKKIAIGVVDPPEICRWKHPIRWRRSFEKRSSTFQSSGWW